MKDEPGLALEHGPLKERDPHQYRRFRFVTRVTLRGGQSALWRTENISLGGIFACATPALAPGTPIAIAFTLPQATAEIEVQAEVAWVNDRGQPGFDSAKPSGMGLRFVDLRPEFREMIRAFVSTGALPRTR